MGSREWLSESRGPYEYDDARYQKEFGAAVTEIRQALEPMANIAADWTSCPMDTEQVLRARVDLEAENTALKTQLKEAIGLAKDVADICRIGEKEYAIKVPDMVQMTDLCTKAVQLLELPQR